jgi:hypothetical protein
LPIGLGGGLGTGLEIRESISSGAIGQIPGLAKACCMFSSVKALSYTGLNINQKKSFDILTRDSPFAISLSSSQEYTVKSG